MGQILKNKSEGAEALLQTPGHKGLALHTTGRALFFTAMTDLEAAWKLSCKPEGDGNLAELHVL